MSEPPGEIDPEPPLDVDDHTQIAAGDTIDGEEIRIGGSRVGRLGRYEITGRLGRGGMGDVYRAHDPSIERDVAIKVLSADVSASPQHLQRFQGEARAAGGLSHPNVVTIYEVGSEGPTHYLVMECVSGGSVADDLGTGSGFPVVEATRIMVEACRGVAAAHARGLVHRDLKPANLLRTQEGTVKVADFGLAKGVDRGTMEITAAGQVVGTPFYMSPEQCEGQPLDSRSDVYSLGATYYTLLTGACPYEGAGSALQVMYAHRNQPPPDPRDVDASIPVACSKIVAHAMAKSPEDRYPSCEAFADDLNAVLSTLTGAGIQLPSESGQRGALPPADGDSRPSSSTSRGRSRFATIAIATVLACGLMAAVAAYLLPNRGGQSPDPGSSAADDRPIRVGVLHSLTGSMATSESPVVDATVLAIEELNEGGGLLGRRVEAVIVDGRSDADTFAEEARRLIVEEKVHVVFGCWTSASRKTVRPVVEELDHLLVYPVQYEGLEESPNIVYTGAAPNQQLLPAVEWAVDQGHRRFFLVGSDYVFPRTANAILEDWIAESEGEIVGTTYLPLGSTDVDEVVEAILAARPDVVLNTVNGDGNAALFGALRSRDDASTIATISFSIGEEELRHMNLAKMTNDYAAWNYFQSIDTPANRQFVERFHRKFGPQRVLNDPMEAAYFGVLLWAAAVREAKSVDVAEVRRSLRTQRLDAPEGLVRVDPETQHTFKTPRLGKVTASGQFDIVWAAPGPVAPVPYPASRTAERWKVFLHDLYTGWGNRWSAPEHSGGE